MAAKAKSFSPERMETGSSPSRSSRETTNWSMGLRSAPKRVGRFTPLKGRVYNFPRNVRFDDDKRLAVENTLIAVIELSQ